MRPRRAGRSGCCCWRGGAHSPQTATFAVLNGMDHARHFSHQKRLTAEVAHLLVGEKSPAHVAVEADARSTRISR